MPSLRDILYNALMGSNRPQDPGPTISNNPPEVRNSAVNQLLNMRSNADMYGSVLQDTPGAPNISIIPGALRNAAIADRLANVRGIDLRSPLNLTRFQREATLEEANPARGSWHFTTYPGSTYMNSPHSVEGGPRKITQDLQLNNPFITEQKFSSLATAVKKLIGEGDNWKIEFAKLPNNVQKQVLSHAGATSVHHSVHLEELMKERLGAELLKRQGYDSVVGLADSGSINEVVKLRDTKGTHFKFTPEESAVNEMKRVLGKKSKLSIVPKNPSTDKNVSDFVGQFSKSNDKISFEEQVLNNWGIKSEEHGLGDASSALQTLMLDSSPNNMMTVYEELKYALPKSISPISITNIMKDYISKINK